MSEDIITKNQINEYVNKKLKELDDIHNRIKNRFIRGECLNEDDPDFIKYRCCIGRIDIVICNFNNLQNHLKNNY